MSVELTTDLVALIMQQGYPGKGFAISPQYPGNTAYEKLVVVDEATKPTEEDIIAMGQALNLIP